MGEDVEVILAGQKKLTPSLRKALKDRVRKWSSHPGLPPGAHRTVRETLASYGSSQQVWMHETLPFRLVPDPLLSREALHSRTITALSTLLRPHPPHRLGNSADGSQVPHLTLINSRATSVPRANNPGPSCSHPIALSYRYTKICSFDVVVFFRHFTMVVHFRSPPLILHDPCGSFP